MADRTGVRREWLNDSYFLYVSEAYPLQTDALLLARFARLPDGGRACDLGTGCGAVPFVWCSEGVQIQIDGVERQPEAAALARRTAAENRWIHVAIHTGDWRALPACLPAEGYSLVTCNPPYFPAGSGPACRGPAGRLSRFEYGPSLLADLAGAAGYLLRQGGSFCLCHRPERLADVFVALRQAGLEPKRLQWVQQRADDAPWLFLLESKKGGRPGLRVLPPLRREGASFETLTDLSGQPVPDPAV